MALDTQNLFTISTNMLRTISTAYFFLNGFFNYDFLESISLEDQLEFLNQFQLHRKDYYKDILFNSYFMPFCPRTICLFNEKCAKFNKYTFYIDKIYNHLNSKYIKDLISKHKFESEY